MNEIIPFEFESRQVRTVVIQGEPWFVAKDVALTLGYEDTKRAVQMHCKRAVAQGGQIASLHPQTVIVPESDVFRLVMRSRLPAAERFEEWVYEEVLPTIRQTGGVYMTAQKAEEILADPDLIIGLAQQVKQLKAERDAAIRTKAHISEKREASAMGTASAATKKAAKFEKENTAFHKKDEVRKEYRAFTNKFKRICAHCGYRINGNSPAYGVPVEGQPWKHVVHAKCLEAHLMERVDPLKYETSDF